MAAHGDQNRDRTTRDIARGRWRSLEREMDEIERGSRRWLRTKLGLRFHGGKGSLGCVLEEENEPQGLWWSTIARYGEISPKTLVSIHGSL